MLYQGYVNINFWTSVWNSLRNFIDEMTGMTSNWQVSFVCMDTNGFRDQASRFKAADECLFRKNHGL